MKKIIILIPLILLGSCTILGSETQDPRITELETQIQVLKREKTRLQEENELLKIGWIPSSVQTSSSSGWTTVVGANSLFPEGSTFEESNGAECMKKAYETYISEWIKKCKSIGYTDAEIQKDKCQLDIPVIQSLEKQKTNAEAACWPQ